MEEKRWKPKVGERYWRFLGEIEVTETFWANYHSDYASFDAGNCFKTATEAQAAAEKVKALLLSLHEDKKTFEKKWLAQAQENILKEMVKKPYKIPKQKLTADVFKRLDCPEWAKFAAVNGNGCLLFFEERPERSVQYDHIWISGGNYVNVGNGFDTSDWENSVLEKVHVLPEWCKVGEWAYSTVYKEYTQISDVDEFEVTLKDGAYCSVGLEAFFEDYRPARLRPYNAEEMESMVGLTVRWGNNSEIITGFKKNKWGNFVVKGACGWYDAKHLLENFTAYGSPCGVFEHLEDGEWVK